MPLCFGIIHLALSVKKTSANKTRHCHTNISLGLKDDVVSWHQCQSWSPTQSFRVSLAYIAITRLAHNLYTWQVMQPSLHDLRFCFRHWPWALVPSRFTWHRSSFCNKKQIKNVFPLSLDNSITKLIALILLSFALINWIASTFLSIFQCFSFDFNNTWCNLDNDGTSLPCRNIAFCLTNGIQLETIHCFANHWQVLSNDFDHKLTDSTKSPPFWPNHSSFDQITAALTTYPTTVTFDCTTAAFDCTTVAFDCTTVAFHHTTADLTE